MIRRFYFLLAGLGMLAGLGSSCRKPQPARGALRGDPQTTNLSALSIVPSSTPPVAAAHPEPPVFTWPAETGSTMEVAAAVMVTVELDFGAAIPSIAEALRTVDRRYQPDDGQGRTFAILDAYGEPTADGKLHISMHVSTEKAGRGALVFRRTGAVLWQTRIKPSTHDAASFTGKNLDILIADEQGHDHVLDGAGVSDSILDALVRDQGLPLREVWPEGSERQFTFFYSACGCPVKIMCLRQGEQALRTKDLPVIFPDDPGVLATISHLLGWGKS